MPGKADFAGARVALTPTTMDDGTTGYKLQVDGTSGSASGPQPAASSQSVTPASDGTAFRTRVVDAAGTETSFGTAISTGSFAAGQTVIPMRAYPVLSDGTNFTPARGDASGAYMRAPPASVSSALSGTIATSGATAALAMTAATKSEVINASSATLWASWATPAVNGAGSFPIAPGGQYTADRVAGTLTLLSTAVTQPYTVNRFAF